MENPGIIFSSTKKIKSLDSHTINNIKIPITKIIDEYYGEVQKMGGRVIPKLMEMYPADEKGKKTIMNYNSIVFDAQLPANIFSLNQIKQLRD